MLSITSSRWVMTLPSLELSAEAIITDAHTQTVCLLHSQSWDNLVEIDPPGTGTRNRLVQG